VRSALTAAVSSGTAPHVVHHGVRAPGHAAIVIITRASRRALAVATFTRWYPGTTEADEVPDRRVRVRSSRQAGATRRRDDGPWLVRYSTGWWPVGYVLAHVLYGNSCSPFNI
jgi:hypothetical protein